MNFEFSEELDQLRDTARELLLKRRSVAAARKVLDNRGQYDRELWSEMASMGWIGASIPEQYGGMGLGRLPICVLAEEIGRAITPVPFSSSVYLAAEALMQFGSAEQKQKYLAQLAVGEAIGTFACSEGVGPMNPESFDTRVAAGKLTGFKVAVPDGFVADFAIVAIKAGHTGHSLYIVDLAGPGVSRTVTETFDPSRGHADISFQDAAVETLPDAIGPAPVLALLDRAAILMSFEQVGVAQAAMEMARDYAKERFAFGRPIGSFQAIKHRLVDMYVSIELARSNAYYGAWALESDALELPVAAAAARVAACDAGWLAAKENIQIHGGMGFTWELDCHLYYRRAKLLSLALGSAREWKRKLIGHLRAAGNGGLETTA